MDKLSLVVTLFLFVSVESVKVSTPLGDLNGNVNFNESISFLRIPFANAPIGELRFQPPQSPLNWNKTLDATKSGPTCVQAEPIVGEYRKFSEDCLTLDIYVDGVSVNGSAKMPVLVFIHGGSFVSGSSAEFDLRKFVAGRGIIAVAIQYRLGLLGFAQSPDDTMITGNNGLLDQVAALKWVKNYIKYFGGDASNMTVAGQSAGSISIAYHLVSPLAANLIERAILESGAYRTLPVLSSETVQNNMQEVIAFVDCEGGDEAQQLQCLKEVPTDKLLAVQKKLSNKFTFTPSIDSRYFKNLNPIDQTRNGNFTNRLRSLMVGQVGNEGALFLGIYAPKIFPLRGKMIPKLWFKFELEAATPFIKQMARPAWKKIVAATFDGRKALRESELANNMGRVLGDYLFNCPNHEFVESYVESYPRTKVYYYDFLVRPVKPATRLLMPYITDAIHSEELQFVYGRPLLNETAYTESEVNFSDQLVEEWTTFVKIGSVADKKWPLVELIDGQVQPAHKIFLDPVRSQYSVGFPDNYCAQLDGFFLNQLM